jgi:hypothetical protein
MEQQGCIYRVLCLESCKSYIGQHGKETIQQRKKQHLADIHNKRYNYPFHNAIRKYGKDSFVWEVLYTGPLSTLNAMEAYYAEMYETYIWDYPGGYNAVWCGETNGRRGLKNSPEHIEKTRQGNLGKKNSPEHIEKTRQANIGRKKSAEACKRMSDAQRKLCKKMSPEAKQKIREAHLGRKNSEEHNKNISKGRMGIRPSDETLEKLRRPKTPEHIEKLRLAWIKRKADKAAKEMEGPVSTAEKIILLN